MISILELLKEDHRKLQAVMDEIEGLKQITDSRYPDLFAQFKKLFHEHDEIEEELLYPELEGFPEFDRLVVKGMEAHHIVRVGIMELRLVPFGSERWAPKFSVIRDSILCHMKEEEEVLFPKVEATFNEEALEDLGKKMLRRRQEQNS